MLLDLLTLILFLTFFSLFLFFQSAHYLNVKGLFDLTCQTVADMMNGRTPDVIRVMFNIKNDYTKEEMEEVQRENAWAFE